MAFYLGLALTIVAAAGPARVSRRILYLSRGNEIIFVLDVSPSMAAADFQPDRLEAAKAIIDGFLAGRRNESIGLVAFGAEAALVCPPTLDYPSLRRRLVELRAGQFGDGTALGSGLATALAHSANSLAPEKYIVLLTDGENNAGAIAPATVVAMAAGRGVSVSVVGVGTRGEVPLSYLDPATGQRRTGSYRSDFDSASLESLAAAGGGKYYAAESVDALKLAFDSISERSSSLARTRSISEEESLLAPILGLGLACLVLARLLELLSGGGFL
jgi:Ca-activated chloride channel family protein